MTRELKINVQNPNIILEHINIGKRFVCFLDILGFSNKVKECKDIYKLSNIIRNKLIPSINTCHKGTWITEKIKIVHFSDSIILYTVDDSINSFLLLLIATNKLIAQCFSFEFYLRGAISHGDFIVEKNHFLGKALIDAVEMEAKHEWSGCVVLENCVKLIDGRINPSPLDTHTIKYKVPLKTGKVQDYYSLCSWVCLLEDIDIKRYLEKEEKGLEWQNKIKIDNTKAFIKYIKANI